MTLRTLRSSRRRVATTTLAALATVGLTAGLTGCGKAAELGTEQLIESQSGGKVDLDLNGDGGFAVQTEGGGMSIDEDGNFVITDENGETVTGNADGESGEFNMESEDGNFRIDSSGDLPEEWPGDIPRPEGLASATSSVQSSADELAISMTGTADGDFVDSYGSGLESAGYERTSSSDSPGNVTRVYENDAWTVVVGAFGEDGDQQVSVSIYSSTP